MAEKMWNEEMSPDTRPRIRGENNCKYCAENKERDGIAGFRLRIRKQTTIKNASRKRNTYFHVRGEKGIYCCIVRKIKMTNGVCKHHVVQNYSGTSIQDVVHKR
jgi:hypothetical protein